MKTIDRPAPAHMPLLLPLAGLLTGILAARWSGVSAGTATLMLLILLPAMGTAGVILRGNRYAGATVLLVIFCCLGCWRYADWHDRQLTPGYLDVLPLQADSLWLHIEGIHRFDPLIVRAAPGEIQLDTARLKTAGSLLVEIPAPHPEIDPGDLLVLAGATIEALPGPRNPGQFDYRRYLQDQGIGGRIRIESSAWRRHTPGRPSLEKLLLNPIRRHLRTAITRHVRPPADGLLLALLLGERDRLDPHIVRQFQDAGIMHLLAISGLHVGFLTVIFHLLLSFLPLSFKTRYALLILILSGYMLLIGSPPVYRAALMTILFLGAVLLERRILIYHPILTSAFLILLWQPQQLFWIGFQFSYLAVISIVYFYQHIHSRLLKWLMPAVAGHRQRRIDRWILAPLAVSVAAQIGTLPMTLYYFHQFSPIAILLNLVAIPLTAALLAVGVIYLACAAFSTMAGSLVAALLEHICSLLFTITGAALHTPGALIHLPGFGAAHGLLLGGTLLLIMHFQRHWLRRAMALLLAAGALYLGSAGILNTPAMDIITLDVGQGDATLLRTPAGKTILIDTGPDNRSGTMSRRLLLPALRTLGSRHIDFLLVSHPHADHMGSLFSLVDLVPIDSVFLPPFHGRYHWHDSLQAFLNEKEIARRVLRAGDRLIIDPETRAYVLGPLPENEVPRTPSSADINNGSLVVLLKHRSHHLLFTGDAETAAETHLGRWSAVLAAQFLKVGHHGSATSTSEDFLAMIAPKYAAISVGAGNTFGHPAAAVLHRLSAYGASVLQTDRERAIWLRIERDNSWRRIAWQREKTF